MKTLKNTVLLIGILFVSAGKIQAQTFKWRDSVQFRLPNTLYPLKSTYYCSNLGFFCKQELKLDKLTVLPMRFRLGSLNYVNYLEQKPNARLRPL